MSSKRKFTPTVLVAVGASCVLALPAYAFEDGDCSRIETVEQSYTAELKANDNADAVRAKATNEMVKQAIAQVVGFDIKSQRDETTKIVNDQADARYHDAQEAMLAGRVRVREVEEQKTALPSGQSIKFVDEIKVCIPKSTAIRAAEKDRQERLAHPPHEVSSATAVWFNPVSGQAQVWYAIREDGSYAFFDNSGFDPQTGMALKEISAKSLKDYRAYVIRKKRMEVAALAFEKRRAEEQATSDRQQKLAAEHHLEILAHARENCDRLAANPNDPSKPAGITGAPWDDLKENVAEAIEACQAALNSDQTDQRIKYQFARAISVNDPKRAAPIFKELCSAHYPAAYDNYGWTFVDRRVGLHNLDAALAFFRKGAQLGDSDAMVSLAGYIQKGKVPGSGFNEAVALYQRAANLGNQDAEKSLEPLRAAQRQAQEQQRQAESQRQRDAQNAQAVMSLFGGMVRGMR